MSNCKAWQELFKLIFKITTSCGVWNTLSEFLSELIKIQAKLIGQMVFRTGQVKLFAGSCFYQATHLQAS
jgi:hypothetical protein